MLLSLDEPERTDFWASVTDLLLQWNLDERLVRLLDISADSRQLAGIGVTDSGLIDLALTHGCLLITDDERTLMSSALARGVDCRLTKHLGGV